MIIDGGFQSHGETPKSSSIYIYIYIIDGFSTINHPFWGTASYKLVYKPQ